MSATMPRVDDAALTDDNAVVHPEPEPSDTVATNYHIPALKGMEEAAAAPAMASHQPTSEATQTYEPQPIPEKPESEAEADEPELEACPICLTEMTDRALTDQCFHAFCFECIRLWSEVNPSCPLCKKPFGAILHNIRSADLFDCYRLPTPAASKSRPSGRIDSAYSRWQSSRRAAARTRSDRPLRPRVAAAEQRRQAVYAARLRVQPEYDPTLQRRLRDIGPASFSHPDALRRVTPWLERELRVLVGPHNAAFVLNYVQSLLQRVDFRSTALVHPMLEPFLFRHTDHFLHEFVAFAQSPLDMIAYDQHARYEPPSHTRHRDARRYLHLVQDVLRQHSHVDAEAHRAELAAQAADEHRSTMAERRRRKSRLNPAGWGHQTSRDVPRGLDGLDTLSDHESIDSDEERQGIQRARRARRRHARSDWAGTSSSEHRSRSRLDHQVSSEEDQMDPYGAEPRQRSRWDSPEPDVEHEDGMATPPHVRAMARAAIADLRSTNQSGTTTVSALRARQRSPVHRATTRPESVPTRTGTPPEAKRSKPQEALQASVDALREQVQVRKKRILQLKLQALRHQTDGTAPNS